MRCSLFVILALAACQDPAALTDWNNDRAAAGGSCVEPLAPADFDTLHQSFFLPSESNFSFTGDTPVISGSSMALGGLYNVQFYELDELGQYQPTTYLTGPSGYAFGRELTMSDGHAFIGETNYVEPGTTGLTGRVRAYDRDEQGQWTLNPHTPYITAADLGLVSGSAHIGVGYEIQMQGTTAVVGVQRADGGGNTAKGVFRYSDEAGWELDALWTNTDAGTSAIGEDYIAIYKRLSFAIDVYKRTDGTWSTTPVATIPRPPAGSSQYGRCSNCMKFDGDRLIVGDLYANSEVGGAFVFERQASGEGFSLVQTILPPNRGSQYGDLWGFTLATATDHLYVGGANVGAVRSYSWDEGSGQYVFIDEITDTSSSGMGRGISVDGNRVLLGRGKAAQSEGANTARARLYVGTDGVLGYCDPPVETACEVGAPFDWDGDGEDDGCRGDNVTIDPSVTIPAGTQAGDDVQVLAGALLGSGNILENGVTVGVRVVMGDNNRVSANAILSRSTTLGSDNVLLPGTMTGRSVRIGDGNTLGGSLGYGVEVGNNLNLPDATVGSLVLIGADTTAPGQIDCPGPLVVARSTVIATDPANGFTCTGSVVVGPDSTVEGAAMADNIRIRKQAFLGATVTVGSGARIGRSAVLHGGVEVGSDARIATRVEVCDTSEVVTGRLPRTTVDPTCP